jgi:hypothetical protein
VLAGGADPPRSLLGSFAVFASSVEAACRAFTDCRPFSDVHRRSPGTAHRVPTPMNRSRRHTSRVHRAKTQRTRDMARSSVFNERAAGVPNAYCRVAYPNDPKNIRARTESFPALGLFASPLLIRLTSTLEPRQRFEWSQPWLACDRAERPEGAHCSTNTGSSDRLLQPTSSIFKDENPASRAATGSLQGSSPPLPDEPLGFTPSRLTSDGPRASSH